MRNQSEPSNFAAIKTPISKEALDQLFYEARTHSTWLPEPVPVELLPKAYELARLGPTSANGSPARFVFLTTPGAKASQASSSAGQCRQDHGCSCDGDHRLGYGISRAFSPSLSPCGHAFVFRRKWTSDRGERLSEQFVASRLLHPGRARFGIRLRTDVRFQRREIECGILSRRQVEGESSLQPGLWRPKQAAPTQSSAQF